MKIFDAPILHKVLIRAPRENVYDAMTTAEGLDGWFTKGYFVGRKPGGKIILRWVDWGVDKVNTQTEAPIIEVKLPERFVFKWWEDHYTIVEMDFIEVKEGTVVSVKEHGYQDSTEGHVRCLECATGWGEALTLLKFYVEHGLRY
ncbi:MAG: SRPBCC domain-containing protein [Candidatus Heimdallarchaeota archaeon]